MPIRAATAMKQDYALNFMAEIFAIVSIIRLGLSGLVTYHPCSSAEIVGKWSQLMGLIMLRPEMIIVSVHRILVELAIEQLG